MLSDTVCRLFFYHSFLDFITHFLYKRETCVYKIETYAFIYFFIHYSGKQLFTTMLAQFRRAIEPLVQALISCIKAYMLVVLFYLFVALSVTAIKESAHNPNHWA